MDKHNVFISTDKDYIIELERKNLNLFSFGSDDNSLKYLCIMRFKNNLGVVIKEITISDLTASIFIDNIYNFLEFGSMDCYFHFNASNSTLEEYAVKIYLEPFDIKIDGQYRSYSYKQIFQLFSYYDERLIPIVSFDISDNLVELIDKIYDTFLIDDERYALMNPRDFLM